MIRSVTRSRSLIWGAFVVSSLSVIAGASGCGGGGGKVKLKPTVSASGKVEFDGSPVPSGTVTFINKATGNMATCQISNGTYSCKKEDGPNPGENTVTILGLKDEKGEKLWTGAWSEQVQVGEAEYKGDFSVDSKKLKKPAKGAKKPVSEMEDT